MRCGPVLMLIALLLGTGAAVPVKQTQNVQENFDLNQFFGTWFSIAIGCNCQWFPILKANISIFKLTISASETTNKMNGSFTYDRNGTCVNVTTEYDVLGIPGNFKYTSPEVHGFMSDIRIVRTNYHEYSFVIFDNKRHANKTQSVALYGRTRKLRNEINEQFTEFALEQGIPADRIAFLPEAGACVPWDPIPESPVKDRARRTLGAEDEEGSAFGPLTNTTRSEVSCRLLPDAGPCFGYLAKFHYNHSSMTCEKFTFGGCMGNSNNFATERECLQTCRSVAACRLPIEVGPCRSIVKLWAFDSVIGKCITFNYSGCQGNGNKFYTRKECEEYCDAVPEGEDELLAVPKKV